LFVKLRPGYTLDKSLAERIRKTIRASLTARHVPKAILQVSDIPYTRSGKKVEMAVSQAIHGENVSNLSALANPEAMEEFFAMGRQWPMGF
jgi:acetoacetyl-CoA synthetase